MPTPRIPPLRIIDDRPTTSARARAGHRTKPQPSLVPGYLATLLAFVFLLFGLFSSQQIYPSIHLPVWSEIAIALSFPTIVWGAVRLG